MTILSLFTLSHGSIFLLVFFFFFFIIFLLLSPPNRTETSRETKRQKAPDMISSSASSSSSSPHHVFPSFSGVDVRLTLLSHVRKELERQGIVIFKDYGIERSRSIWHELVQAIQESRVAIVVLSVNYASSCWCLNELLVIMKCKEDFDQKVIPIFYKVDPSDVRKQSGDFGRAFKRTCAAISVDEKKRWQEALTEVANIAGLPFEQWDDEANMIEKIATYVSDVLNFTPSRDFAEMVGMGTHMGKMMPLLCLGSNEVRFIGILGPAGIGKTTIARALFDTHSARFQLYCFMENVKGSCERTNNDIYGLKRYLQQRLLSEIFDNKSIRIHHLGVAAERLKHHKVLLVLDDVDKLEQLEALANDTRSFGLGSRIIVTTQNIKLLRAHRINHVYEVPYPSCHEALQIFCQYAFGKSSPPHGFNCLAVEIAHLAGNLPLALSVLGSSLRGESKEGWNLALPRLRSSLDGDIEKTLKAGFDCLSCKDKSIFLHIACLFNYEKAAYVAQMLANSNLDIDFGLKVLVERSLIHIEKSGYIWMHDLLEKLGREIVSRQSKRQFLLEAEDIYDMIAHNTGTKGRNVLGISIKTLELPEELFIKGKTFENLPNLRFLMISGEARLNVTEDLADLPPKLCLLQWEYYPMKTLPSEFRPKFLVELKMRFSKLEKLWEGTQPLGNLKYMDLSYSYGLEEIPDLSEATNLEDMYLSGCSSLVSLPDFPKACNLEYLNLSGCKSLVSLPDFPEVWNLRYLSLRDCESLVTLPDFPKGSDLYNLNLSGCSSLVTLPDFPKTWNLKKLDLSGCSSLVTLPDFSEACNLEYLNLSGCKSLVTRLDFPEAWNLRYLNLSGFSSLVTLPDFPKSWNLQYLNLSGCSSLVTLPNFPEAWNVKDLNLGGCKSLVTLPDFSEAWNLQYLNLRGCESLVALPHFPKTWTLQYLSLKGCGSLVTLPDFPKSWILQYLNLSGCSSLVTLPSTFWELNKLENLYLEGCANLEALPSGNINLESLRKLIVSGCSKLKTFPEISRNIEILEMRGTPVGEVPSSIRQWTLLTHVDMPDCRNLKTFPHFPTSVEYLWLSKTGIEEVPPWIQDLSRLKELRMDYREKLRIIAPNICKLEHLEYLSFDGCKSVTSFPPEIFSSDQLYLRDIHHKSLPQCLPGKALTSVRYLCLDNCDFESIPDYFKHLSRLHTLGLSCCKKLASLSELPHSLRTLRAYNCESLERISCSLLKRGLELNFMNCFKLNQKARELIWQSDSEIVVFPGREMPVPLALQASGSSLTIALDRMVTPSSLRFKACIVLAPETIIKPWHRLEVRISPCHPRDEYFGWKRFNFNRDGYGPIETHTLTEEHLLIISDIRPFIDSDVGADEMTHNELAFEFSCGDGEILRCGVEFMEDDTSSQVNS